MANRKISIIGAGYVGLVTGVSLAYLGHKVVCVDCDQKKVEKINRGEVPFYEKGLEEMLKEVLAKNLFSAAVDLNSAVLNTEITFIAAPTPSKEDSGIDLSFIEDISCCIAKALSLKNDYHTIVVKSTVVPETCSKTVLPLIEKESGRKAGQFGLCMNPEFLREGKAVYDFMNPDRIVIGELDKKSGDILAEVYSGFNVEIIRTSLENAEITKYVGNALLANLISFSNEISNICEQIPGADINEVLKGVYLDRRLNPIVNNQRVNPEALAYIYPGCGFGGSCLPKDVNALIAFSKNKDYQPNFLSEIININKTRPNHIVNLAEKELVSLADKKIAVLGLAFKPDTDDLRDSPSILVIKELLNRKAKVAVFDPVVKPDKIISFFGNSVEFSSSLDEVIRDKDACLLITRWEDFKKITPDLLKKEMRNPLLIDGRGFLNKKDFFGVRYISIGSGEKKKKKILIIGSSGQLGGALVDALSRNKNFEAVGTDKIDSKFTSHLLDIAKKEEVEDIFKKINPDTVILTAGLVNVDVCEENKELAYNINVKGAENIISSVKEIKAKLIYISSAYVFDGEKGYYKEEDVPNPINYYGQTKLEIEKNIQKELDDYIIIRPIWIFDLGYDDRNFIVRLIKALKNKEIVKVPNDQYGNPTLARNIAWGVEEMIEKDKKGIYNIGGRDAMNKYQWAVITARNFSLDDSLIIPVSSEELGQKAKRPKKCDLDLSKAQKELKTKMLYLDEALEILKDEQRAA